jgi:hypothetical protein
MQVPGKPASECRRIKKAEMVGCQNEGTFFGNILKATHFKTMK